MKFFAIMIFCVGFFSFQNNVNADWPKTAVYETDGQWKTEPNNVPGIESCGEESSTYAEIVARDIKSVKVRDKKVEVEKSVNFEVIFRSDLTIIFQDIQSIEADIHYRNASFLGVRRDASGKLTLFFMRAYFINDKTCADILTAPAKIGKMKNSKK